MSSITFYGGPRELGGNQILLEDRGVRIFLDFGLNFDRYGKYFLWPESPRKHNALNVFLNKGMYPDLPGIYRNDYLKQIERKPEEKSIDGVLLSHAHLDHAAGIHFLRPDIDIYTDISTKKILKTLQVTGGSPFYEFIECTYYNELVPKVGGEGLRPLREGEATKRRPIKTFQSFFRIGDDKKGYIEVVAYPVDHSMPGACAFIIYSSKGPIVYTGDFRVRSGRRKEDTEAFIEAARQAKPKILLCEGSLIDRDLEGTEDGIVSKAANEISKYKGLITVTYPPRDLDRIETFRRIARKTGRQLVIDTRQAYLLDRFNGAYGYPKTTSKQIRIFVPRRGAGLLDTEHEDLWERDYPYWEREYIWHKNRVTLEELNKNPEDFIMYLSRSLLPDLLELDPPKGSRHIDSVSEPYTEEMELREKVNNNWLREHNLYTEDGERQLSLLGDDISGIQPWHITGHSNYQDTEYVVNRINSEILAPIHTLHPEWFKDMYKGDVRIVERGEKLEL